MPQVALLCRGVVHLSAQRALASRVVLTRRFYQWRCEAVLGKGDEEDEEDEQVRTTRASVLSAFASTDLLTAELAQVSGELEAHERALRKNGSRVVLRQFLKQRLFANIQRAFTLWAVLAQAGKGLSVPLSLIKKGFRAVKAEESHAKDSQTQNTRLRFALLVYVFHLKWRSNAKIAALAAAREESEHCRRVLWSEVCALRRGLAKVDEYEAAVLVTAHKRGGDTFESLEKLRANLRSLPSSFQQQQQQQQHRHQHRTHHRHHHHRNRAQRSRSISPERSRSPSPERRTPPPAPEPASPAAAMPSSPSDSAAAAAATAAAAAAAAKGFTVAALPPPRLQHPRSSVARGPSFVGPVPPPGGESSRGPRRETVSAGGTGTRVSVNLSSSASSSKRASVAP